ncbi:hypothetical protein BDV93DRAFT_566635 [Ceratobasidium sp. AG-I]|nr:hypothetical protein BDV93DRAFT_566635 [Ceratobasidium sp. AG-I]
MLVPTSQFKSTLIGRDVALKCSRRFIEPTGQLRKALKHATRELHVWPKFKHDNAVQLLGLAIFRGEIAMVSPFVVHGSLLVYLEKTATADRYLLPAMDTGATLYRDDNPPGSGKRIIYEICYHEPRRSRVGLRATQQRAEHEVELFKLLQEYGQAQRQLDEKAEGELEAEMTPTRGRMEKLRISAMHLQERKQIRSSLQMERQAQDGRTLAGHLVPSSRQQLLQERKPAFRQRFLPNDQYE